MKETKILLFFKKKREILLHFYTFHHFYSESLQKEQISTNLLPGAQSMVRQTSICLTQILRLVIFFAW